LPKSPAEVYLGGAGAVLLPYLHVGLLVVSFKGLHVLLTQLGLPQDVKESRKRDGVEIILEVEESNEHPATAMPQRLEAAEQSNSLPSSGPSRTESLLHLLENATRL